MKHNGKIAIFWECATTCGNTSRACARPAYAAQMTDTPAMGDLLAAARLPDPVTLVYPGAKARP